MVSVLHFFGHSTTPDKYLGISSIYFPRNPVELVGEFVLRGHEK